MEKETIIQIENLTKVFKLPHEKITSAKQQFVSLFSSKGYERFKALDNVSFEIRKGEFFGIIGANGSGKSTLLKILAGIYQPTSGQITINGNLSPFIELGVGFNPELSARDNVFLNAAILGLTKQQTEEEFAEIVSFSELENFMDQKLKNFSSGMQVRLAFSIAIHAQAEILLIDEVLAVGDSAFQQKCFDVFRDLKKKGKTVIFVSHDLTAVQDFCDRVLLMKNGSAKFTGDGSQAILEYLKLNTFNKSETKDKPLKGRVSNPHINQVSCLDKNGRPKNIFELGEDISVKLELKNSKGKNLNFGVAVYRNDNTYCCGVNTILDKKSIGNKVGNVLVKFTAPNILPGSYYVIVAIFGRTVNEVLDFSQRAAGFNIVGNPTNEGVIRLDHEWKIS